MAKSAKKDDPGKPTALKRKPKSSKRKPDKRKPDERHAGKPRPGKPKPGKPKPGKQAKAKALRLAEALPAEESGAVVLDRLWSVVLSRREADPAVSHSARLLSRGTSKVAQKFGEEAIECLIEAVSGNRDALIAESADVLYHLLVLWVDAGVRPAEIWNELRLREGISGIAEKASRARILPLAMGVNTSKIP